MLNSTYPDDMYKFCMFLSSNKPLMANLHLTLFPPPSVLWQRILCCVLFHAHPNSTPQKLRWNLKIWKPKDFYDFLYYPNNWDIALFVYFAALTSKQNPGIKKTLNPGLFREQIFSIDILQLWSSQSEGNLLKSVLHCYSKIQFMVYKHLIIDSIR